MTELRLTVRVALEETTRYFRGFNRRVLVFLAFAAAVGAVLFPIILARGVVPDEGIYRAEISPDSPLLEVARADRQFEVFEGFGARFYSASVDLYIQRTTIYYADTERGVAAIHDFAEFVERYYDSRLSLEPNQTAAFPVRVNAVYQTRSLSPVELAAAERGRPPSEASYSLPAESMVLLQPGDAQLALTPGTVEPPFPMRSLLLTFAFLVPYNFVGQYYAGSLLGERTRQRGVLLLSAPLTGRQILLGKTLPYAAFALLFSAVVTPLLGAGPVGFLATLPIFAFFLAATAFSALIARSYRELTFLITTMSVALSTYLFLPAIFVQVHSIAFMSPVSVIAASIRDETVPLASFLYSITPLSLAAFVLALLCFALYREEDLFAPRAISSKILDGLHSTLTARSRFLYAGALAVPFVFAAELFVLAFAISLPLRFALGLFLVGVALVEETAKFLPALAHYRRSRTPAPPVAVGALLGAGFFLGEKLALLFSIVGLGLLPLGGTLLASYGVSASALLVFAPLALHGTTAILLAFAARRGGVAIPGGFLVAVLVHVLYNWTVIRAVA